VKNKQKQKKQKKEN